MKKIPLNPLSLSKETIALLDAAQLKAIAGGQLFVAEDCCHTGGTAASYYPQCSGDSSGCNAGGSTCLA